MPSALRRAVPICVFVLTWAGVLAGQQPIREVIDDDVDRAIQRTVRFLYGRQQANGHWPGDYRIPHGGSTALALFALLEAGENPGHEQMVKGLNALIELDTKFLYIRALRAMVLSQAGGRLMDEKFRKVLQADLKWLGTGAAGAGAWTYSGPDRQGDNSCSQFGILALYEAIRSGEEIDANVVRTVERTWISRQKKDGGWTYAGTVGTQGESTPSMTAAGIASMFLCQDALAGGTCRPYAYKKVLEQGLDWLGPQLKPDFTKDGYLAFCVQRVGMAGGLKFIGAMDWFATGAREMVKPQPYGPSYAGPWGPDVRAGFELIFLARGRIPLVFNKLAYGTESGWDSHSRDIAQFAEYMRRTFEQRMRWQIVNIADDLRLLLDAPILLVTADKVPQLNDSEWAKLREYSLRGGTLLFMPVHFNKAFTDAVTEKLGTLYAEQRKESPRYYQITPVPAGDPIYSAYKPMASGDKVFPLTGVSDGTRWLAILSPTDTACSWQRMASLAQPAHFDFATNLFMYATGANHLGSRMRPVFVGSDQPVRQTVKVGWLRHDGNWNTQPYALDYLSQKLAAENRVGIELASRVRPGEDDLRPFKLLWLTGTDAFELTDGEVAALRRYLDDGGTMFVNAVGGSEPFMIAFEKVLAGLARGRAGLRTGAANDSGLMTGKLGEHRGLPLDDPARVRNWKKNAPRAPGPLETYIEADWPRVIIARNGVHDTLDGHMTWSAMSYMPQAAGQIAANVVLYALMDKPKPPAPETQPEETPTSAPEPTTAPGNAIR